MNPIAATTTHRERELSAIISAYNEVTEQLKVSHERLGAEVMKLRREIEDKNRELARQHRLASLGQMATGVAHEIRNPLGSIQLYASLLDKDLKALPDSQRLVRKISAGVSQLDHIVGEILDFAGRHEPEPRQTSLEILVSSVLDAASAKATVRRVKLIADGTLAEHEVWVDESQMKRALLNVILNAIDASPESSQVSVSAESSEAEWVSLDVCDEGMGIPEEAMEHIFDPFFTTKDMGTGLGLAIVHRIIEAHGGRITVANRPEGGARFRLYIPTDVRSCGKRAYRVANEQHTHEGKVGI